MDLIVHFPTMGIKRNIEMPTYTAHVDRLFGSDAWQTTVGRDPENVVKLIPLMKDRSRESIRSRGPCWRTSARSCS